ncbi:hypothetical protein HDV04_006314 [Boothiomyces sp. JEL0838]|nr:hypothetical protein HDV04_006314 [Boothiomyces sp. JEL0838]
MKTTDKEKEKMVGILKRINEMEINDSIEKIDPKEIEKMELNELTNLLTDQQLKEFNEFIKTESVHHLIEIKQPWWIKEIKEEQESEIQLKRYKIKTNPDLIYCSIELVYSFVKAYRTNNCEIDNDFLQLFKDSFVLKNNYIFSSTSEVMDLVENHLKKDLEIIFESKENVLRVFGDLIDNLELKKRQNFLLLKKLEYYYALVSSMEISLLYSEITNYKKIEYKELVQEL